MITANTLRPGLLVSLKTSSRGNVNYTKITLESNHTTQEGSEREKWETTRTVADANEHKAAQVARAAAAAKVRAVCAVSAFGLLCPETRAQELESAIREGEQLIADFNKTATLSRLSFNVIAGRIAPDDERAVRAIRSEISDLIADMERGVSNLDPETIRNAANRARSVAQMLPEEAAGRAQFAIDAARKAARKITAAGETAAQEVDRGTIAALQYARTAFLDLEEAAEIARPEEQGRGLDLPPERENFMGEPPAPGETVEIIPGPTRVVVPVPVPLEIEAAPPVATVSATPREIEV